MVHTQLRPIWKCSQRDHDPKIRFLAFSKTLVKVCLWRSLKIGGRKSRLDLCAKLEGQVRARRPHSGFHILPSYELPWTYQARCALHSFWSQNTGNKIRMIPSVHVSEDNREERRRAIKAEWRGRPWETFQGHSNRQCDLQVERKKAFSGFGEWRQGPVNRYHLSTRPELQRHQTYQQILQA